MSLMQTMPFVCQDCGKQFSPAEGGICAQCKRVLCGRHLLGWVGQFTMRPVRQPTCLRCRAAKPDTHEKEP